MVLLGTGCTEQSHDAIAENLVHRASEPMNRVYHDLQYGEQTIIGILRIASRDQLGGLHDIGKHDGDDLTLPVLRSDIRLFRGHHASRWLSGGAGAATGPSSLWSWRTIPQKPVFLDSAAFQCSLVLMMLSYGVTKTGTKDSMITGP